MERNGWNKKKYLIDGFPRNMDNYQGWNDVMGDISEVSLILVFNASEEAMTDRILKRGESSGRTDDNLEVLKKRFKTFNEETMPVIKIYEEAGKVRYIDGMKPIDEVYKEVTGVLADYI